MEKKIIFKNKDSLRELYKQTTIHIIRFPEEERETVTENLFEEIMAENYVGKGNRHQVQEAQIVPNKFNPERPKHQKLKIKHKQ